MAIKEIIDGMEADVNKFDDAGTKASGKRIRKGLQEIKKMAQEFRKDIQAKING